MAARVSKATNSMNRKTKRTKTVCVLKVMHTHTAAQTLSLSLSHAHAHTAAHPQKLRFALKLVDAHALEGFGVCPQPQHGPHNRRDAARIESGQQSIGENARELGVEEGAHRVGCVQTGLSLTLSLNRRFFLFLSTPLPQRL